MSGVGYADQHDRAGQVAGVERLLPGLGAADRVDDDVGAEAAGELLDRLDRRRCSLLFTVCVAPSFARPLELPVVEVDGDDRRRPGQSRARRPPPRRRRRSRSPRRVLPRATLPVLIAAPRPAITPQPSSPTAAGRADGSTFVHCPACTRVFSANAPMPSAGDSSVPSSSVIFWVALWVREAVPRLAAVAGPAVAADRAPVEDHEVAGRDVGDALADRLDDAGGLVAEQEREVVVDAALAVVQVGVADPAGLDLRPPPRRDRGRGR